jgi:hypothetical protein
VPEVVEPGTRLVERYRLEERLGGDPATTWLAHDELLDRPVAVCLLSATDPAAEPLVSAARGAAAITDARFLRVLDAAHEGGLVYVVSEWVASRTLTDLVSDGPLPPAEARDLALDLAAALAVAHAAGLYHLAVTPDAVRRTEHGQVKLAGLGVTAAAEGMPWPEPAEAARRDTESAGAVLYAALTGRWPGDRATALPPAPLDGDAPCSPRQVRAGVPDPLDDVVARALALPGRHGGEPFTRVEQLHAALADIDLGPRHGGPLEEPPDQSGLDPVTRESPVRPRPRRGPRVAWLLVGLVLVVGLALAGGQLAMSGLDRDQRATEVPGPEEPGGENSVGPLEVDSVTAFDPEGNGEEHDSQAPLVVDDDPDTAWSTMTYFDPLPLQKGGVGLVLDLGETHPVTEVTLRLAGGPTDLEVRVSDSSGSQPDDFRSVAEESGADGEVTVDFDQVDARYVLVWLTDLPQVGEAEYRAQISEVDVRG